MDFKKVGTEKIYNNLYEPIKKIASVIKNLVENKNKMYKRKSKCNFKHIITALLLYTKKSYYQTEITKDINKFYGSNIARSTIFDKLDNITLDEIKDLFNSIKKTLLINTDKKLIAVDGTTSTVINKDKDKIKKIYTLQCYDITEKIPYEIYTYTDDPTFFKSINMDLKKPTKAGRF